MTVDYNRPVPTRSECKRKKRELLNQEYQLYSATKELIRQTKFEDNELVQATLNHITAKADALKMQFNDQVKQPEIVELINFEPFKRKQEQAECTLGHYGLANKVKEGEAKYG